ncbi:MAG: YlbF family regulator [Clostridia bacterium]|nr:YlbF family regulator [Clostridia bacterium]
MNVIEQAQILGQTIKASPELVKYFAAKAEYEQDRELQQNLFEYETQRKILGQEFAKDPSEQTPELITSIRDRIQDLASEIVTSPTYREYEEAKKAVNALMEQVNAEISFHVFGQRPSSCTHDCSSCSGCASHAQDEEDED